MADAKRDANRVPSLIGILDSDGTTPTLVEVNAQGETLVVDSVSNSLTRKVYDYISLTYTGSNLTGVIFKAGGSGGTTVSTLALAYTGAQLDSVTRT